MMQGVHVRLNLGLPWLKQHSIRVIPLLTTKLDRGVLSSDGKMRKKTEAATG
jgi:hypothetical protein